jgi:cellulose synthase/poly-beta-1,6-N-acetylglucosamine synthase-like glycosyltransferase
VQGHRIAKNQNTSFAVLDAISEEINNHIFRKGHRVLGFSSAIIGSGMAFRYDFFRDIMKDVNAVGGFDKELELKMLKNGHKIDYLDDALVYDEKVQNPEVFANQRRRWLAAQFHYFRQDIVPAVKMLFSRGNFDYFDKSVQFIQPPRILLLAGVTLLSIIFILYNQLNHMPVYYTVSWLALVLVCAAAFIIAVPRSFYNSRTLRALGSLPQGIVLMLLSLLKIKGANMKFIHTKHGSN